MDNNGIVTLCSFNFFSNTLRLNSDSPSLFLNIRIQMMQNPVAEDLVNSDSDFIYYMYKIYKITMICPFYPCLLSCIYLNLFNCLY